VNRLWVWWWIGAAALVYASLLPFAFVPLSWESALARFAATPWLALGAAQRADWMANLLIYLPWAYLGMAALAPRWGRFGAAALVAVLAAGLALGIEFAQLYFPGRTVSRNDLVAEALGALLGIALWFGARRRVRALLTAVWARGDRSVRAALALYAVAYVGLALFPFDFVLTTSELAAQWQAFSHHWLLAPEVCDTPFRCFVKLLAEVAAAVPLGLWWGARAPRNGRAMGAGLALGLLFEGAQLLLVSGIVQGASVLTRGLGVALGAWLWGAVAGYAGRWSAADTALWLRHARRAVVPFVPFYLGALFLLFVKGETQWSLETAAAQLAQLRFIPFYYHYYTSETVAFVSVMAHFCAYAIAGVLVWLRSPLTATEAPPAPRDVVRWAWRGALVAGLLSALIEILRLLAPGQRPDPTDVLIAASGGYAAVRFCAWLWTLGRQPPPLARAPRAEDERPPSTRAPAVPLSPALLARRAVALAVLGGALTLAMSLPLVGPAVAAAVLGYFLLLRLFPAAWLLLLPTALVVFNLAPWTGRFFIDEADAWLLATVAGHLWHPAPPRAPTARHGDALMVVFGALVVGYAVSVALALWPWPPLDANALNNYYSPYNVLRVSKSLFWAVLLWPVLQATHARGHDVRHGLVSGVLLALCGVTLTILWERGAFPGLFNFTDDHRVTGSFAAMNTGGAALDGFLALAVPLIVWLPRRGARIWLWAAVVLTVLAVYAVLMTYTRSTYAALVLATAILLLFAARREGARPRALPALAAGLALLASGGLLYSVLQGGYIGSRFATVERDSATRLDHWRLALDQMTPEPLTLWFGMGPGRFPGVYFWHALHQTASATPANPAPPVPANYRLVNDGDARVLTLGFGDPLYLDQRVAFDPEQTYRLAARYRSEDPQIHPRITLCEKTLLYSYRCAWYDLAAETDDDGWRRAAHEIVPARQAPSWQPARIRVVSIALVGRPTAVLELAELSLRDCDGREWLRNGTFTQGLDHWFPVVDNYWPWHIENMLVSAYFETGLWGAAVFVLLLSVVATRLMWRAWRGDPVAPLFLASLVAVLTVGVFSSLFDDARLGVLLWLFFVIAGARRFWPAPAVGRPVVARRSGGRSRL